jgi:hypothetical protein
MAQRDARFERERSGSELQIKIEMERRLGDYFAKKHGSVWQWCPVCQVWTLVHQHQGLRQG